MKHPWMSDISANCMMDFIKFMHEKFSPEAFRLRYANQNVPKTDEEVFGSILTDAQRAMTNHLPVAVIDLRNGEYCHADYIKSIETEVGQWGSRVVCKMESGISANILDVRIITNDEYKQIMQR